MGRILENLLNRALFHLVAPEHHHHAIRHLRHHRHVMGDEHHRRAGFALQPVHQRQYFGLDRHVQRRCRFIRDQQARLACHRHGNHHPLTHPTRKLVRILQQPPLRLGDTYLLQQFQRARLGLRPGHLLVQPQPLGQLTTHGEHRIQRRHRLLKDHTDLVAANRAHQILIGFRQIRLAVFAAIKQQPAARNLTTAELYQPHQRQAGNRFTGPGFANDTNGFARKNLERNILYPHNRTVLCLEFDLQVLDRGNGPVQHRDNSPRGVGVCSGPNATDSAARKSNTGLRNDRIAQRHPKRNACFFRAAGLR